MTPDDTRNLFKQEDEGWSRAMELALTPVVAAGIGYFVDRVLGTVPVFAIIFFLLAVAGTFIKMFYAYDVKMKAHDAEAPWGRAQAHAADRVADQSADEAMAAQRARAKRHVATTRDAAADHAAADRAAADHTSGHAAAAPARQAPDAPAPAPADHGADRV